MEPSEIHYIVWLRPHCNWKLSWIKRRSWTHQLSTPGHPEQHV